MQSFIINPDGTLSAPQDSISTNGDSPAFTAALSTGQVAVMNYGTGNGRIIPTTGAALRFDQSASVITFPKKPNTVSHPHMAVEHGNEIFVPDLVRSVYPFSRARPDLKLFRAKILSGDSARAKLTRLPSSSKALSHNQPEADHAISPFSVCTCLLSSFLPKSTTNYDV